MARVTATIQLTLDCEVSSAWNDECSLGQVRKQSLQSAIAMINKAIEKDSKIKLSLKSPVCTEIKYMDDK